MPTLMSWAKDLAGFKNCEIKIITSNDVVFIGLSVSMCMLSIVGIIHYIGINVKFYTHKRGMK